MDMRKHWTKHIRDFKKEELDELKEIGAADWVYINGEVHFQRRFYENLIKTRPDLAERVSRETEIPVLCHVAEERFADHLSDLREPVFPITIKMKKPWEI